MRSTVLPLQRPHVPCACQRDLENVSPSLVIATTSHPSSSALHLKCWHHVLSAPCGVHEVAGNTYTTAAERPSDDGLGNVWVELGLRARDVRVRCIFQYGRDAKDGAADVQRVYLVREGLGRLPPEDVVAEVGASSGGMNEDPQKVSLFTIIWGLLRLCFFDDVQCAAGTASRTLSISRAVA